MPVQTRHFWALVGALALLGGCATKPPSPAPVESRTRPSAPAASVPSRPAAATPAPAPAPAVRAEPVRPSGVQVRPLESRPLEPAPAARPADRPAEGRASPETLRTQPQGLKRPYSDAALAELRGAGAESSAGTRAEAPPPAREEPRTETRPAPQAEPRPAEQKPEARAEAGFVWPARGKVIQGFAEPRNMGIAIAGNPGDPVLAAADGRVIFSGPGPRGYGNLVIVKHDADTLSVYAHNRALLVKDGAQVRRGQQIAELGESGTDRPKLHFEIRRNGKPVDPVKLLPPR